MQREFYSRFVDLAVKIAGFYLLVLGLILTSKDARGYLSSDDLARGTAVAVVLIAWKWRLTLMRPPVVKA